MNSINVKVAARKPLVKNLLLVEGISRSGKFLLSNILAGFDDIEPVQTHVGLEHIPIFESLGLIKTAAARELLRSEIDVYCYETLIGRTLNLRESDKSTIFNHPRRKEFLRRAKAADTKALLQKFQESRSYSLFIGHELLPHLNLYFEVFPELKVINLKRSPVDLAASWQGRGYGDRIAVDPTFFTIPFSGKQGPVPWYALSFKDKFYQLSPMDRIIRSIEEMMAMNQKAALSLRQKQKRLILFVSYEELMMNPWGAVRRLGKFLDKQARPVMKQILQREQLPNPGRLWEKEEKLQAIRRLATKENLARLLKLEKDYQASLQL